MLCLIPIVGGLLIMMGQHDRSEALFTTPILRSCSGREVGQFEISEISGELVS